MALVELRRPYLIWLLGYMPFFIVGYWVHDQPSRRKQVGVVAGLASVVAAGLVVFGGVLGWI